MFQSAFRWIWVGSIGPTFPEDQLNCFNPLFAGYGLEAVLFLAHPKPCIGFNPLFAGYGLEEKKHRCRTSNIRSFNPLFAGYGLESRKDDQR